jgi:selenocysteine lyase/cysteine desulfurase
VIDHPLRTRAAGDRAPDELAAYVAHCDEPAGYLNFAHVGPPLRAAVDARHAALRVTATSDPVGPLEEIREAARRRAAAVIGGDVGVTFAASTTEGLFATAFGLAASGTLLVPEGEFPANAVPWLRAAARGGPAVRRVPQDAGRITAGALRSALDAGVVGLTVSAVDYRTGWKAPLADLREVLGPDRLLIVDAIQGFGITELDLDVADVVVAGGQKWLRSGWGAAILGVRPRALELIAPDLGGWTGLADPYGGSAGTELGAPAEGPDRLLMTNTDLEAIAGLHASLGLVVEAGTTRLADRLGQVVAVLLDVLRHRGAEVLGDDWPERRRAGIVSFRLPGEAPEATLARLSAGGVTAAVRGGLVRLSPHVSTTEETVRRFADAL